MTQTVPATQRDEPGSAEIDWIAAERSPEFQQLVKKRRGFVLPATIFFLGWYFAFVLLAGYAPEFMGSSIYQGFTVGYALALTQFLMVWILGGLYLRRADRDFDPLAKRAAETAIEAGRAKARGGATATAASAHDGASTGDGPSGSDGRDHGETGATGPDHEGAPAPPARGPTPEGAGDGGQAPPGLRSAPTPGAAQSRPVRNDDR